MTPLPVRAPRGACSFGRARPLAASQAAPSSTVVDAGAPRAVVELVVRVVVVAAVAAEEYVALRAQVAEGLAPPLTAKQEQAVERKLGEAKAATGSYRV